MESESAVYVVPATGIAGFHSQISFGDGIHPCAGRDCQPCRVLYQPRATEQAGV